MKNYHPLLLSRLKIHLPGLHIRRLELHRHLSETDSVSPHTHSYSQYLCYLNGEGWQEINGQSYVIRAGTAVYLPAQITHAFRRQGHRRPICLAIDFEWGEKKPEPRVEILPTTVLRELRQHLSRLGHLTAPHPSNLDSLTLIISSEILAVLDLLLHRKNHLDTSTPQPITQKINRFLEAQHTSIGLREIANQTGYQYDYLNRRLRAESGLTLGQLKNRRLLERVKLSLRSCQSVGDAAESNGFSDSNYFSRWFLKQTGLTPTKWRNAPPSEISNFRK